MGESTSVHGVEVEVRAITDEVAQEPSDQIRAEPRSPDEDRHRRL